MKQQLELYVERVQDPDPGLQKVALESMRFAFLSIIQLMQKLLLYRYCTLSVEVYNYDIDWHVGLNRFMQSVHFLRAFIF